MNEKRLLQSDTVCLRALEPTDLEKIWQWENDTALWTVSNTLAPYSKHQIWQYLQDNDGDIYRTKQLRLIIVANDDNEPAGCVDLFDFNPQHGRAEVGLMLDERYRGRGLADDVLRLLLEYARETLALNQLYVYIDARHTAVRDIFLRCGFTETATLRQWVRRGRSYADVTFLQTFLNDQNP